MSTMNIVPPSEEDRYVSEEDMLREGIPYEPAVIVDPQTSDVERALEQVTRKGFSGMSPVERIATLTAIADAVKAKLDWEKSRVIENLTGATENHSIPTPLGNVSYKAASRPIKIDEEKLLAYVKHVAPEAVTVETREVIDSEVRALLVKDVVDCGDGDFARGGTGETIDYAYLGEPTNPTISWPASAAQKIVKAQARRALDDQLQAIASPMFEAIERAAS